MKSLKNSLEMYQKLLQETELQEGYRELISYITRLQVHFKNRFVEYEVSKGMYQGYLDLSFFTITTEELRARQLKIGIVFLHKEMRFYAWLSGRNRSVMSTFRKKLEGQNIGGYLLANDEKGMDSIIEGVLVDKPNFDDLNGLTREIEANIVKFVDDVEKILGEIS